MFIPVNELFNRDKLYALQKMQVMANLKYPSSERYLVDHHSNQVRGKYYPIIPLDFSVHVWLWKKICDRINISCLMLIIKLSRSNRSLLLVQVIYLYHRLHISMSSLLIRGLNPMKWELFLLHTIEWERIGNIEQDSIFGWFF